MELVAGIWGVVCLTCTAGRCGVLVHRVLCGRTQRVPGEGKGGVPVGPFTHACAREKFCMGPENQHLQSPRRALRKQILVSNKEGDCPSPLFTPFPMPSVPPCPWPWVPCSGVSLVPATTSWGRAPFGVCLGGQWGVLASPPGALPAHFLSHPLYNFHKVLPREPAHT